MLIHEVFDHSISLTLHPPPNRISHRSGTRVVNLVICFRVTDPKPTERLATYNVILEYNIELTEHTTQFASRSPDARTAPPVQTRSPTRRPSGDSSKRSFHRPKRPASILSL